SPQPVTNKEFTKALAKALKRPAFFRVPMFALKLFLGELADSITASIKAHPRRLIQNDFKFLYPEIKGALESLVK
ncbi:MAG TPA: epimerase, partial [Thermodesulfobacterium commune]|nr:epimerase [Thermodesulfobacterium commune]